ncbi:MAG: hypothetical protein U0736_06265 [Gemmataceae bacterium]
MWRARSALALQVRKKDAQRAAVVRTIELPRKTDVPLAFTVELSAGHELLFLPFVDPWHNASTITLTELTIEGSESGKPAFRLAERHWAPR